MEIDPFGAKMAKKDQNDHDLPRDTGCGVASNPATQSVPTKQKTQGG